ncbi:MAG: DUF3618 domain-containing protein [Bacteroidota bacterium]|nr:DUF3618 domain-containing protein [Kiloniellaceae bacterium]
MDHHTASPEQLEREIVATRAEIDRKVALLQHRLSLRTVAGQVASSAQAQGGAFARNLGAAVRDNPVPALLVGIGLCWLILASRSNGRPAGKAARPETDEVTREAARAAPLPQAASPSLPPRTAAAMAAAEEQPLPSRGIASGQR